MYAQISGANAGTALLDSLGERKHGLFWWWGGAGGGERSFVSMKHEDLSYEEIAARAHQIYLESGRRNGHDINDYELMRLPVRELAKLTVSKISKARVEAKSLIEVVRATML
jgi:hypothetical protein